METPKCPLTGEQQIMVYHIMEYYLGINRNKILIHSTKWKIMFSWRVEETPKRTYSIIPCGELSREVKCFIP